MLLVAALYTGCETTGGPPPAMLGMASAGYAGMAANQSLPAQQRAVAAGMSHVMSAEARRQYEEESQRQNQQGMVEAKQNTGGFTVVPGQSQSTVIREGIQLTPRIITGGTDEKPTLTYCKSPNGEIITNSTAFYRDDFVTAAADIDIFGYKNIRYVAKDQNGEILVDNRTTTPIDGRPKLPRGKEYTIILQEDFMNFNVKVFSQCLANKYQQQPTGNRPYQIEFFVNEETVPQKTITFTINYDQDDPRH